MKIRDIAVTTLLFEYDETDRFQYAGGVCTHRVTSLVQVFTDTGPVGIGSTYSHPDLVRVIVEDHLRPFLVGRDPTDTVALWTEMDGLTRWYGRKGVALSAAGALDVAFWDLRGKAAGKPVRELLGSRTSTIPAYASALLWKDDIGELAAEAARHRDEGFVRMKMRLGRGVDYDLAAVDAVLSAIGPEGEVMVDGSMRYDLESAAALARELESRRVLWFEEPFLPDHIDDFRALKARTTTPLAAGENEFGYHGFRELIRADAIDVVQADVSRCGGITEAFAVGKLAADHSKRVAPHSWSDAVAVIANAHYAAALDNAITVEVDQTGNPFVDSLLGDRLPIRDGLLHLNDEPGLGITLDQDIVDRFTLPRGTPLPPGSYSDMAFK
ncbi:MAG: mandelate racemase/muconate lactonizing enzyme family protein [Hyphomicrobiales bacterium]|nr:mandelate racemase/muconate lactonizing enzyme family protein [Hyphomicrobiales bacterium]